ncbi:MAG: HAMP domain-containing histidine kinase, partial [Gammaproteobacteria bacterium]|nr:HAMP domain-containing histidine kinase [Gammaproteobacteria bacterium]
LSLVENGVTGSINDQALELIKNANRNSTRLANLVNDLLDSEKMASGKMRYDIQECEIAALIKKSVEINQPVANQAGVKLSFSHEFLAHAKVIVLVDPDRFIQVMTNLLANAIKFTPVGGEVEAGLQLLVDEIRVSVTDHGSGVPEAFRANIFNKFSQADSSDTRKHGGTGLGLSIAKFIIEKFNGRIDYTSIPDKETTFFFILPVVNSSVKQNP